MPDMQIANCAGRRRLQAFGENISELFGGVHCPPGPYETNASILSRFVREALSNVDVLRTLTPPDDTGTVAGTPYDAGLVVLVDRSPSFGVKSHVDG
jgi:hypothetical protein